MPIDLPDKGVTNVCLQSVLLCFSVSDLGAASSILDQLEKEKAVVLLLKVCAHLLAETYSEHEFTMMLRRDSIFD